MPWRWELAHDRYSVKYSRWWNPTKIGKRTQSTSNYNYVHLKRHIINNKCEYFSVLKQSITGEWINLGDFDSENEAIDFLVDEVETMDLIQQLNDDYIEAPQERRSRSERI